MNTKKIALVFVALFSTVLLSGITALAESPAQPLEGSQVNFGGSVTVPASETRDGDVVAFGGNVTVDGTVTRNAVALGGNVIVNGTVDRDVVAVGGDVTLGPQAHVLRDVSITGGVLNRAQGAVIDGRVVYGNANNFRFPTAAVTPSNFLFNGGSILLGIIVAIGILLLALLILLFFPRQLQTTGLTLEQRPLESFGLGCGGVIAGIALAILFAITIIFSPVSFLIVTAMTAAWLFGWAAIFLITGQRLLHSFQRPQELVPALLLGGVIIGILANVPVLNILVILIGGSFALGSVIYSRFGTHPVFAMPATSIATTGANPAPPSNQPPSPA